MNSKELIRKEVARVGLKKVLSAYCGIEGNKEATLRTALDRGQISKGMAFDLETITLISALFWMLPAKYDTNGDRR